MSVFTRNQLNYTVHTLRTLRIYLPEYPVEPNGSQLMDSGRDRHG